MIVVIENDDSIAANTIIGMNPEYTRNNILKWKAFNVYESIVNMLYFTYTRPNNEPGAGTLPIITSTSFINDRLLWSSFFVTLRPNFCHRVYATP